MKKYKTKIRNGQLEIKHRLGRGEELNNRELEILARNNIRGLARVQETSSRGITFVSPEAIPLSTYLGGGLTKEDFAFVIAQIVRIAQKVNDYSLQQNNLELTLETVYIVKKTRELIFIYRPVISVTATSDINSFMNSVIRCTSFSQQQNTKYVEELENVLRRMEKFPSEMMSNYVRRLDSQIFDLFLGGRKSGAISRKDEEMTSLIDDDLTGLLDDDDDFTSILDEDLDAKGFYEGGAPLIETALGGNSSAQKYFSDDDLTTGILDEESDDDLTTGILDEESDDDLTTGILDEESDDDLTTGILDEDDDLTGILTNENGKEIKGQSLLFGDDDEGDLYGYYGRNFGSTTVVGDEPVTSLANDEELSRPTSYDECRDLSKQYIPSDDKTTLYRERPSTPWIQRCSNGERRNVDKPVFRIGKDKYHVDYFVDNNPAVSRNHAHIVSRNGRYFIVDDNSLNHSFVDGMIIPIQKEYEIFEGSNICLANEDFIFHTK